ncbi:hypothetical protein CPC16_009490, partial [Podila verticillata]
EFVNSDMEEEHQIRSTEEQDQVFHPSLDMFLINTSPSLVYSSNTALSAPASATEFDFGTHFGLFDLASPTSGSSSTPQYSTTPNTPTFAPLNFQMELQNQILLQQQQQQAQPSSPSPS